MRNFWRWIYWNRFCPYRMQHVIWKRFLGHP